MDGYLPFSYRICHCLRLGPYEIRTEDGRDRLGSWRIVVNATERTVQINAVHTHFSETSFLNGFYDSLTGLS